MSTSTHTHDQAVQDQVEATRVAATGRRLYDAEVALHIAHTSHVDEWITAAADRLHEALVDYENAAGITAVTPS